MTVLFRTATTLIDIHLHLVMGNIIFQCILISSLDPGVKIKVRENYNFLKP